MTTVFASVCYCIVGSNIGSPDKDALHVLECDSETGAAKIVQSVKGIEGTTYFEISPQGRLSQRQIFCREGGFSISAGRIMASAHSDCQTGDG